MGKVVVRLNQEQKITLKSQLDSTITLLNYSKNLTITQKALTSLQNENNILQSKFYSQFVGGDSIDNSFVIPIVINTKDYLPIMAIYGNDEWKTDNLAEIASYARPVKMTNGKYENVPPPKLDYPSSIIYLGQVMQYKMVADMASAQTMWSVSSEINTEKPKNNDSISLYHPFRLKKHDVIKGDYILKCFSKRIISQDYMQINNWKYVGITVPKMTTLRLDSTTYEYLVTLSNQGHFKAIIGIEYILSTSNLPAGVTALDDSKTVNQELAKKSNTYYFQIHTCAKLYNLESQETIEDKKWLEWLFGQLKKLNYGI